LFEGWSCKWADVIKATIESYKQIEIERCGAKPENTYVVRNGLDLKIVKMTEPIKDIKKMEV